MRRKSLQQPPSQLCGQTRLDLACPSPRQSQVSLRLSPEARSLLLDQWHVLGKAYMPKDEEDSTTATFTAVWADQAWYHVPLTQAIAGELLLLTTLLSAACRGSMVRSARDEPHTPAACQATWCCWRASTRLLP